MTTLEELGPSTYAFEAGMVLYSKLRPYLNKVVVADRDGFATTELVPLRVDPEKVFPAYLAYYLRSAKFLAFANTVVAGAKMPRMVMSEFWRHEAPIPSLAEQRRIAGILDKVDLLRVKRREALAYLDSLAQSIYLEMFGDPVTNPKGWPDLTLGGVVSDMQYGPRFHNEVYVENGTRIVRITDLDDLGNLDFDSMPKLAVDDEAIDQYALQAGDVIFARTGATVGKCSLIKKDVPQCIAGAYFIRMRFRECLLPEYAFAVLMTKSVKSIVTAQSRQAAQQNFSGPGLRRLPMPTPPLTLQEKFSERITEIQSQRVKYQASFNAIDSLFATLQDRAFRGEL
ncbi:MAG: restriction endonuclease subunit S [Pseudomonadota bacterium]